jgi:hypothetical protein
VKASRKATRAEVSASFSGVHSITKCFLAAPPSVDVQAEVDAPRWCFWLMLSAAAAAAAVQREITFLLSDV